MATEEQLRNLTGMVLEALNYQRYGGGNDNPALGRAIQYVDDLLLPWARSQAGDELDVDNMVADAALKMLRVFPAFRGTTGREFLAT
ncbi:MAG TPA: hypothetical protein VG125_17445 [Pirellulales bacterium]|jgi:hypothetical protein|nr:hypothetical protein [Pirellulales bacterium]